MKIANHRLFLGSTGSCWPGQGKSGLESKGPELGWLEREQSSHPGLCVFPEVEDDFCA